MSYQFKTFKGNSTDVLHSKEFLSKTFKNRQLIAFDKEMRKKLNKEDALLLRGYATAIAQLNAANAYKYKKNNNFKNENKNSNKSPF